MTVTKDEKTAHTSEEENKNMRLLLTAFLGAYKLVCKLDMNYYLIAVVILILIILLTKNVGPVYQRL